MTDSNTTSAQNQNDSNRQAVHDTSERIEDKIKTLETFIARRFDEISMEINATSQQVDMAEEGLSSRFGEILKIVNAISYSGEGLTAANTGVELDAVIEMTENAANKIMDAANIVGEVIGDPDNFNNDKRQATLDQIQNQLNDIYMACSFQDITGQRIRKTLENLEVIEDRINGVAENLGLEIDKSAKGGDVIESSTGISQDDIDSMFDD